MKAAEILRKLADIFDNQDGDQPVSTSTQTMGEPVDVNVEPMVPPLQQKLELLKKLSGIGNYFDEGPCTECGQEPCECDGEEQPEGEIQIIDVTPDQEQPSQEQPDELEAMKKMAGIFGASEDNDIEG
jgi:hypothetical protein